MKNILSVLKVIKVANKCTCNDMAFNKAAEFKPAHNVYHNDWSVDELQSRLIRAANAGEQTILEGLLSTLENDIKTDLANTKLNKDDTIKHYQKYVNMLKNINVKYYNASIKNSLNRIRQNGIKDTNDECNSSNDIIDVHDSADDVYEIRNERGIYVVYKNNKRFASCDSFSEAVQEVKDDGGNL